MIVYIFRMIGFVISALLFIAFFAVTITLVILVDLLTLIFTGWWRKNK